jgi:molecular chaperone GrpE
MTKTNVEKELERRGQKTNSECSLDESVAQGTESDEELIASLRLQIEQKEKLIKDGEEKIKLVAADFVNSKNRLEKELQSTRDFAISKFALSLVKILEEIELSISHYNEDKLSESEKTMFQGILMTKSNILSMLESFSISRMNIAKNDKFDYNLHQAVSMVKDETVEKGCIISVFSQGYKISDRILKPAMVIVSA